MPYRARTSASRASSSRAIAVLAACWDRGRADAASDVPGTFSGVTVAVGPMLGSGGQGQHVGPAAPAAPGPMVDVIARPRELASMKADGVLTEAEFEAQEQRVLAQQ